ncbi:MAG: epoxyqueuosine reductase QueH [Clostridia bacterium]|nr:epoxyqueuosine reductase QueH [Clostridia bacterium]
MQKRNYQQELDEIIEKLQKDGSRPSLLLHACCAPCSSYCVEYLSQYFDITLYYYNPNIESQEEFDKRFKEFEKIDERFNVKVVKEIYNAKEFYDSVKGYEDCKEGGDRCTICYRLRLQKSLEYAEKHHFDYFASTLSISPYKNAEKLNTIGENISKGSSVLYLINDFKKKGGYLRSTVLSKEMDLYRQAYCGCVFSKRDAVKEDIDI